MERKHDMGSGGYCICVRCDVRVPHQDGVPCREMLCPECGKIMLREGSEHHQRYLEKKAQKKSEDDGQSEN